MGANQTITLEPQVRIERAGCAISVRTISVNGAIRYRLCLMRDGRAVACEVVARNGSLTTADVARRIAEGSIGPTSDTYRGLVALADVAEQLFVEGV